MGDILKSIRRKCLDCCIGNSKEVELCPDTDCGLYFLRLGINENGLDELQAVEKKCYDCSSANAYDTPTQIKEKVKNCSINDCPLFKNRQW